MARRGAFAPWLLAERLMVRAAVMLSLVAIGLVFFAAFIHAVRIVDIRRVIVAMLPWGHDAA